MTLDYFYGQTGELFSFYRIPKALFQEQRFQSLSTDAKTLYGILLDRMSLSAKNGWLDEQNRVFIIFTIEDVKRSLCCADNKATKLLRELEEFGVIERKRRGLGRPSLVYVKNFSADSSKTRFQNRENHESGGFKSASQDPAKPRCNKTDTVNEVLETLDNAEGWSTWDVMGGGLMADLAKYEELDNAQKQVEQLQVELRRFKTELSDVEITADLQVTVDNFLKFADFFFDGLFADWAVLDHINQAQSRVENTKGQIKRVLALLKKMREDVDVQIADEKEKQEQLAVETEL